MGSTYSIRRKMIKGIIVIILFVILGPSLDMNAALIISLGFGTSISLWSLSNIHESSFMYSQPNKN